LEPDFGLLGRPTFDRRFMVALAIASPSAGIHRAFGKLVEPSAFSLQFSIERRASHVESAGRLLNLESAISNSSS
jgi:hypothetical protein